MTDIEHFLCEQWTNNAEFDSAYWWDRTSILLHGACLLSIWIAPEHMELLNSACKQAHARLKLALSLEVVPKIELEDVL